MRRTVTVRDEQISLKESWCGWILIGRSSTKRKISSSSRFPEPILKIKIVPDYRDPLIKFLRPHMRVLDIGANDRGLKAFIEQQSHLPVEYKSMDVDRTYEHDFYDLTAVQGRIRCLYVFRSHRAYAARSRIGVAPPGLIDCLFQMDGFSFQRLMFITRCHSGPTARILLQYRIRHLAGWMASAGFVKVWGYRVCRMSLRKRLRAWRYWGLLCLLNLDFAPGVVVIGEKG